MDIKGWGCGFILVLMLAGCGRERSLPEGEGTASGLSGAEAIPIRGFEAASSLGRVRLTVFEGESEASSGVRVGSLRQVVRHSVPRESATGVPVLEEWVETLPESVPVIFSGGSNPLLFSAHVNTASAARVRNPLLRSVVREFSRMVSYCSGFYFKGWEFLKSRPSCQPPFYCQTPGEGAYPCTLTGDGQGQCETQEFRLFLTGLPLVSRSFYLWILGEDAAFECRERKVGRTDPVVIPETERLEKLEWVVEPGVRFRIQIPNPQPQGDPWIEREVQFTESLLGFSWDK